MTSCGVLPIGCAPRAEICSTTPGSLIALTVSAWSRRMTGCGVAAGASSAYQSVDSYPGTPDSATVGISGAALDRARPVMASPFSRPARTCGSEGRGLVHMTCTWPLTRSTSAGPAPLYGMCTRSMLVIRFSNSTERWPPVPGPDEA